MDRHLIFGGQHISGDRNEKLWSIALSHTNIKDLKSLLLTAASCTNPHKPQNHIVKQSIPNDP